MAKGDSSGSMVLIMMAHGDKEKQMGLASCIMLMGTCMKAFGLMIKQMVRVPIFMQMGQSILVGGEKISNMAWGSRCGQMTLFTRVCTLKVKNMVAEN